MDQLERCKKWIEAALAYSGKTHVYEDIVEGCKSGKMQLWPADKGCLVTEIIPYPRRKVLNIFLGGGELEQIMDMHEDVIAWAKSQGCNALTMHGRRGWKKPLDKYDWQPLHVSYIKEFE